MSTDPAQRTPSRALSRSNVEKEMELLRRYSNRYLTQNQPSGSYQPAQFSNALGNSTQSNYVTSKGMGIPMTEKKSDVNGSNGVSDGDKKKQQSEHERRRSNLINTTSVGNWDETSMDSTSQAMGEAMRNMMESMQTRVNEESQVLSEMEEKANQDKTFANIENADKWSTLEVCHWLNSIHLQKYITSFHALSIDGSILLQDLDESMLANELGVKKIHLKKCLREIAKLKEAIQSRGEVTEAQKTLRIEELEKQVSALQQSNLKLKENVESLTEQAKQMSSQSQLQRSKSSRNAAPISSNTSQPTSD